MRWLANPWELQGNCRFQYGADPAWCRWIFAARILGAFAQYFDAGNQPEKYAGSIVTDQSRPKMDRIHFFIAS